MKVSFNAGGGAGIWLSAGMISVVTLSTSLLSSSSAASPLPRFYSGSTFFSRGWLTQSSSDGSTQLLSRDGEVTSDTTSSTQSRLFGIVTAEIPRGGGLFGAGNNKDDKKETDGVDGENNAQSTADRPIYPALTRKEIEEWLEHIPVFAVTDASGAGVVLKPDNDSSVFYFFMNPYQANATLTQLQTINAGLNLKVSAFSLGKIWFPLLNSDNQTQQAILKTPPAVVEGTPTTTTVEIASESIVGTNSSTVVTKSVEYRLVPDTRDLLGARMLLTMTPQDGDKLKEAGGTMTAELAQAAIQKAMTESPKFKSTYNEIPVFTIAQMRMQRQPVDEDEKDKSSTDEQVTLLPMYFSLQNMVGTWQQFMSQAPIDIKNVEPAINLMSLHEMIDMMQKDSEIDWRHVVLVPPAPPSAENDDDDGESSLTNRKATDPMAQMGGATLGDV